MRRSRRICAPWARRLRNSRTGSIDRGRPATARSRDPDAKEIIASPWPSPLAGLAAPDETRIHQAECADVSFPGFFEALENIRSGDGS